MEEGGQWVGCDRWEFDGEQWNPSDAHGRRQIRSYRDLDVFNLTYTLAMEVFRLTIHFPKEERYSLVDQVQRSSRSVCANLVEGFARRRHANVFNNSLNSSLGESAETKLWLDFASDCGYLTAADHSRMSIGYEQAGAMLWTLMNRWERFK